MWVHGIKANCLTLITALQTNVAVMMFKYGTGVNKMVGFQPKEVLKSAALNAVSFIDK